MHPKLRRIIPIVVLVTAVGAVVWWYFAAGRAQAQDKSLSASGTIEVTEVRLSAELGGRVLAVNAAEGDFVHQGDVLVQLDTALLDAQRLQAVAALAVAQANAEAAAANLQAAKANQPAAQATLAAAQATLAAAQANQALLQAGATDEQILAADAQLAQAEAGYQALQASLYALTAAYRPEEVNAAWARLLTARQEYYSMTVVLTSQQIEAVRTAMTTAQSNLTQAQARQAELAKDSRTPPAALDAATLAVADAQAALDAATHAYQQAQDPAQPFYAQIEATHISWNLAQQNLLQAKTRQTALEADANMLQEALDAAQATVDDAQVLADDAQAAYEALADSDQAERLNKAWQEAQDALTDLNSMGRGGSTTVETLLNQLAAAAAQRDAAAFNLTSLKNGAQPEQLQAAQAQVDAAQAQVDAAQAQVDIAQSRVDAAQAQLDAAQAQVEAAQAAVDALDVQIAKLTLFAPADGVVLAKNIEPGELAAPGAVLLTLADLERLTITVYIPEDRYGVINLSDTAQVTVDSYPGLIFSGTVTHIADQAEFTPRNVQTAEGRRTTVFAVRLSIENPDGKLKPGMPADVDFGKK